VRDAPIVERPIVETERSLGINYHNTKISILSARKFRRRIVSCADFNLIDQLTFLITSIQSKNMFAESSTAHFGCVSSYKKVYRFNSFNLFSEHMREALNMVNAIQNSDRSKDIVGLTRSTINLALAICFIRTSCPNNKAIQEFKYQPSKIRPHRCQ
jgi:hypothetical protein